MEHEQLKNTVINRNTGKMLRLNVTYLIERDIKLKDEFKEETFLKIVVPDDVEKDWYIEQYLSRYLETNTDVYGFEKVSERYSSSW